MIQGISHITLVVRDPACTGDMLCRVLGARMVYQSGARTFSLAPERFYLLGDVWLCLMQGEGHAGRTYDHVAFCVPEDALDGYAERFRAAGLEIKPSRPRVAGEGRSLYFYDFDNHLFELHTGSLEARLRRYHAESAETVSTSSSVNQLGECHAVSELGKH